MEDMKNSSNDNVETEYAMPDSKKEARLANAAKLKAIMDKNKYFSRREKEYFLRKIANLTISGQILLLSSFEKRKINPHWSPEIFYLYPPELRAVSEGVFLESDRTGKKTTLKKMKEELERRFTEKLLHSALSKYFSESDKKDTMERFKASDLKQRIAMFNAADSWLKFEADGYGKFQKRLASLSRYGRKAAKKAQIFTEQFLMMNGVDRMKILEAVEIAIIEAKEEKKLCRSYAKNLARKRKDRVIAKTTETAYNKWFRKLTLEQKQATLAEFEEHMKPRVDLLMKFEKDIDHDLQKAEETKGKDGFYGLGYHGRMARYNELLEEQRLCATPKITDKTQTQISTGIDKKTSTAPHGKVSEDEIAVAIAATMYASRKTLADLKIVKLYATVAAKRERRNASHEFGKKGRPTQADKLETKLRKSGKVLDYNGERTIGILALDPKRIKEMTDAERYAHLRTAAKLQGSAEARESNTNVGIIHEGRIVMREEASKIVEAMTERTQKKLRDNVMKKLESDGDIEKISDKLAEKITSKISNDNAMHPDLSKAA